MATRQRILLIFFLLGWLPAVLWGCILLAAQRSQSESDFQFRVREETEQISGRIRSALTGRQQQIGLLARSAPLLEYVTAPRPQDPAGVPTSITAPLQQFDANSGGDLRAVYCFSADQKPVLESERAAGGNVSAPWKLRRAAPVLAVTIDQSAWERARSAQSSEIVMRNGFARYAMPLELTDGKRGLLVLDVSLDHLLENELRDDRSRNGYYRLVLDRSGNILSDTPLTVRYQPVSDTFQGFSGIVPKLATNMGGSAEIADRGVSHFVAYRPIGALDLSFAVMQARDGVRNLEQWFFLGGLVVILLLFGVAAYWLNSILRREQFAIERLTQVAAKVASGKLNERIEVRSSAELQVLAESFNQMTDRLREQIARESEARQFQSFLRLSATVTHDLKNAIQALTLLVRNMEVHFDDPDFRAQALAGLTRATEKLNGLVGRLSEPMRSMSGELPRPQPTDISAMLHRVLAATAGQDPRITLATELPETLLVDVDAERVEKVFENLIINAMQAMEAKPGMLTVRATSDADKCTVTITDTGKGMTEEFLRDKLFRAFSTTKPLGIGLGLYTCREVIRAHAGSIEAESKPGSGTTFRVVLPLRAQALWANSAAPSRG
jgi:signal transduction histidine kinase